MKKTGTMTPDGHGGFKIELSDPKKGVMEVLVSLGFAFVTGGVTYLGQWVMQKYLEKNEEAEDKA